MRDYIMKEEMTCLRCGSNNIKPGALQSTGKIYAHPDNAKLETYLTTGVLVI
jgi:predicted nucleic-acid-binding Zn-ribbon protein